MRFNVNFELLIDPLSVLMMLIITGVGGSHSPVFHILHGGG